MQQNFINVEELILVWWTKQYIIAEVFLMNLLLRDLVYQVQFARIFYVSIFIFFLFPPSQFNDKWFYHFKDQYFFIKLLFICQLEYMWYKEAIYEWMECWYNAVKEQLAIHNYNLLNIWNIDKSGLNIGEE